MKLTWKSEEEFEKLVDKIESQSPYKKIPCKHRKWMTVAEMGKMLGLKKTDRYWLVHKNYFKTEIIYGIMRVEIESFEKWYANQVKYRKVDGEEPGKELKKRSLSARDIAELLDVSNSTGYEIMKLYKDDLIIVDDWQRLPTEIFWKWYKGQSRYRTKEDREKDREVEDETISMPEMARLLGVPRSTIYQIIRNEKYQCFFAPVIVADRKRYKKKGFQAFLNFQSDYYLKLEENDQEEKKPEPIEKPVRNKKRFWSLVEAAEYAGVSKSTVCRWCKNEYFPYSKYGKIISISIKEYKEWLKNR